MSTSLKILFNLAEGSSVEEKHLKWTDLQLLEGFENDRDIKFDEYLYELNLYKLAKSEDHWAEIEFANEFKNILNNIDRTPPPCMVMNCDILVGFLNVDNSWNLLGANEVAKFDEIYLKEIFYLVKKLST